MDDSIQLLLACLEYTGTASKRALFKQASIEQWETMLEQSQYHQTTPLLYDRIKKLDIALPDSILKKIRESFLRNFSVNTNLYHQLKVLCDTWREKAIPVIALKGVYLSGAVYENVGLRVMSDVDILVRQESLTEAVSVLTESGYLKKAVSFQEDIRHFHDAYSRKNSPCIELHWKLNETFTNQVDIDKIWAHALPMKVSDCTLYALPHEELIVYLCMHTIQHIHSAMLRMLCDIGEVIRKFGEEIQWDHVVEVANRWDISRAVYAVLKVSQELLRVPVPDSVMEALQPQDLEEEYLNFLRDRFVGYSHKTTLPNNRFSRWIALLRNGWRISLERARIMYAIPKSSWKVVLYLPSFIIKAIGKNRKIIQSAFFVEQKRQEEIEMKYQCMAVRNWLLTGQKTKLHLNIETGTGEEVSS